MRDSLVLRSAARGLLPLLLVFSIFLLLRGHNEPGGGFVGGLVAACAFAVYALGLGVPAARQALRVEPRRLIGLGLLVSLVSGLPGLVQGRPFLSALWLTRELPVLGKLGTPLLFDAGVYLVVAGIALTILYALMEE